MASQAPSPNSSPSGVTPNSTNTSPPPTLSTSSPPLSSPDNNSTNSSPPLSSSDNNSTNSSPPLSSSDNNSTNSSPPLSSSDNNSTNSSPPLSSSDNNSTNSSPPPMSQPNATSNPQPPSSPSSNSSSPPPQSPPPAVPSAPPPVSVSLSPPPPTPTPVTPASEPPTSTPALPPPPTTTPVLNPPPPVTQPPVVSPPPPVQSSPPPSTRPSPPPPTRSSPPPPSRSSPPPPTRSSPPPPNRSPPPVSSPPPAVTSPPPQEVSPPPPPSTAVPPPADSPPPLPSSSPSPPAENPPESSPAPPELTPPPPSISDPTLPPSNSPPTTSSPPVNQTRPTPSPPLLPSQPPTVTPGNNSNTGGTSLGPTPFIPNPPVPTQPSATIVPSSGGNANSTSSGGGVSTGGAVAIGLIVGFVVLSLIGMGVWFLRKKKKQVTGYHAGHVMPSPLGSSPVSDSSHTKAYSSAPLIRHRSGSDIIYSPQDSGILGNSRSWFTYEELKELTNGFSEQNLLGEGGFGCVYKGIMADGREVAVKQLKIGGSQGEREFSAEVETISRVHHRHLVSLVGYCISEHQRLLVYDFVPNNTLYYHLHGEGRPVMDWATRVKVATGAARGISYLHEDCHPRIIHRDIKSSNILLDNNYDAQVSDFGLAKLALDAYTHITTRVMGTFGYMAPEYASSGKLTEKSDVYSFGVVLLELISGRKPVDTSQPMGEESLVEWARPLMSDALENQELEGLIDPRLHKNYVETEMFRMIEAAAACVRHSAGKRPRMGQVLRALDAIGDSTDLTNGIRPGQSEVFNSAQQSAEIRLFQRMAFGSQNYSSDMFSQSSWGS